MDFNSTTNKTYVWPTGKPIVGKPCEPPIPNAPPQAARPPVAPYCHCDAHAYQPLMDQYRQLLEKEQKLCEDYDKLRDQMAQVTNDILDHPCDDLDSKMQTMYKSDFRKRTFPITEYTKIMAAVDSKAPIPVGKHRLGMLRAYKDPTNFSESPPVVRPNVNPPAPVHKGVVPKSVAMYHMDFPGRTEYMDKYSSSAEACWRSMQRYKEPLPSTRRRDDDRCV